MKKRASFILVLPALALSCQPRVETNDKPTAVHQTNNPPASIAAPEPTSTPTSVGAVVQPASTPASVKVEPPPITPPVKTNPPAPVKPQIIHKNPPGFISGGKKPNPLP
jgi:hypothetical protein